VSDPAGNPGANLKSISHRCYLREVAFEWDLTQETIFLPLGCLQDSTGKLNGPSEKLLGKFMTEYAGFPTPLGGLRALRLSEYHLI